MLSLHEHNIGQSYDLAKLHHQMKIQEALSRHHERQLAEQFRPQRKFDVISWARRVLNHLVPASARPNVVIPVQREVK
ncbi:MAG TPA: hypothetical protein VD969_23035 [Symbiobacteriaceae bacterium]|nr:hypothetical protein [Symbiobacteriaceae bacterium]